MFTHALPLCFKVSRKCQGDVNGKNEIKFREKKSGRTPARPLAQLLLLLDARIRSFLKRPTFAHESQRLIDRLHRQRRDVL